MSNFYIKGRRILIVGGAGFIGHNLALRLKSLGSIVEVFDSLLVNNLYSVKSNENNLPYPKLALRTLNQRFDLLKKKKIPLRKVDARDYHSLSRAISNFKPQVIIHLAAVSHANRSNKDPHSTFDHSLRTLENSLDCAKKKIEHFIFLSSSMVYGNFRKEKVKEGDFCKPLGIYGALKYSAEKIIEAYGQVFNLPYTIIRPSALYGERCISRRVGQIFIESALNNSKIIINGNGTEKLDFTYIDDLVEGIISTIKSKNSLQEIFNITYGKSRSVNTLLNIIKQNFQKVDVVYEKRDKLMPIRGTLDTSKAKKLLNFESSWPLERGYIKYINWYKKLYKLL